MNPGNGMLNLQQLFAFFLALVSPIILGQSFGSFQAPYVILLTTYMLVIETETPVIHDLKSDFFSARVHGRPTSRKSRWARKRKVEAAAEGVGLEESRPMVPNLSHGRKAIPMLLSKPWHVSISHHLRWECLNQSIPLHKKDNWSGELMQFQKISKGR